MPQVPIIATPSVAPVSPGPVYQRLDPNAAAWAAPGRALAGLGEAVSSLGVTLAANALKLQNERDSADANNAFINAKVDQAEVDANYFSLEGSNAVDAYPDYVKQLQDIRNKHLAQLGSEKARKLFDNDFTRSTVTDIGAASRHAATQHKIYVSGQSDARVQQAINDSAAKFGNQQAFDTNLLSIREEMAQKGRTEGWSEEKTSFETSKAEGMAYAARIREMAIYDPFTAEKLFNDNMGKLDPDAVPIIENAIRTSRLTVGVKQGIGVVFGGGDVSRPAFVKGIGGGPDVPVPESIASFIKGWDPRFSGRFAALITAAEKATGQKARIREGYRDYATQLKYWNEATDFGKHAPTFAVARPGRSLHQVGMAADVAEGPVLDYIHAHAAEYGLGPASARRGWSYDPGHVQLAGAPRVGAGKIEGGAGGYIGRTISAESGGRSGLISPAGAVGLMQIMPETAKIATREMGIPYSYEHLLHDDSYNVMIGKHILNKLLHKYNGDEMLASAAYNAGEGRVDPFVKKNGIPDTPEERAAFVATLPKETQDYIKKVANSPGVGYDPAPGKAHYVENLNTGTGAAGTPLSVRLQQAQAYAEQVAPGDVEFSERLLSATRTRYGIEDQANTEEEQSAYNLVAQKAISTQATSEEQLFQDRAVREAYQRLDGQKQINIHDLLEKNSKDDIPETQPMQERFFRMREILNNGTPEEKKKIDPFAPPGPGEPELSRRQKAALAEIKTAKRTSSNQKTPEEQININSKFALMRSSLVAAGLIVPAAEENEQTRNNLAAYKGQFTYELTQLAQQLKRVPTDQETMSLGNDLLQKVSFMQPDYWAWKGESAVEVPMFIMSKKSLQNYFGITSDAADVMMRQEVPEDDRKDIIDAYVRKTGGPPATEEIIWKIYQHGQFARQRLISKAQEGELQ